MTITASEIEEYVSSIPAFNADPQAYAQLVSMIESYDQKITSLYGRRYQEAKTAVAEKQKEDPSFKGKVAFTYFLEKKKPLDYELIEHKRQVLELYQSLFPEKTPPFVQDTLSNYHALCWQEKTDGLHLIGYNIKELCDELDIKNDFTLPY